MEADSQHADHFCSQVVHMILIILYHVYGDGRKLSSLTVNVSCRSKSLPMHMHTSCGGPLLMLNAPVHLAQSAHSI